MRPSWNPLLAMNSEAYNNRRSKQATQTYCTFIYFSRRHRRCPCEPGTGASQRPYRRHPHPLVVVLSLLEADALTLEIARRLVACRRRSLRRSRRSCNPSTPSWSVFAAALAASSSSLRPFHASLHKAPGDEGYGWRAAQGERVTMD